MLLASTGSIARPIYEPSEGPAQMIRRDRPGSLRKTSQDIARSYFRNWNERLLAEVLVKSGG